MPALGANCAAQSTFGRRRRLDLGVEPVRRHSVGMSHSSSVLLEGSALRALGPLILGAWEDSFLSPAELLAIRDALEQVTTDPDVRSALHGWLDPKSPPSASELCALERALREQETPGAREPRPACLAENADGVLKSLREVLELGPVGDGASPKVRPAGPTVADVARWRSALDGPQRNVRDEVRTLLQGESFRTFREPDMAAYREQVLAWCRELSQLSVLKRMATPGAATSIADFVGTFETLSLFDLSLTVKFGVQFGLFGGAIQNLGTERHHALLPEVARCELLGCFAMTERAHGSNVRSLQTVARYEPEAQEFVIESPGLAAGKEWIGNAAQHGRLAVVFAQLETQGESHGVHAWLVPIRDIVGNLLPGVRAEDCGQKMGLNGVDNGRLWFDRVRVPREALLDRFGQVAADGTYTSPIPSAGKRFFTMLGTLEGGRINVAAGALAASKAGLAIALRYGAHRTQFPDARGVETPLLDYLVHRQRLVPPLARAYAFTFAIQALLDRVASDEGAARDVGTLAAGLKAVVTWHATDALQQCRECCGGQGYLTANRIDALRTDADVFATFEGDNIVLLQLVAKDLLRSYARQFSDGPLRAIARAAAANIKSAVMEQNPVAVRRSSSDAVRDGEFHIDALLFRERSLLSSLAKRIKRRVDDGQAPQDAFEACQDHAIALARAHTERFVLESFQKAAEGDEVLERLCALYGLSCVEADTAWFLENSYVVTGKARAIRKERNALLGELAPALLGLVDAFGIPDTCLGPLADPTYLKASGLAPEGG